MPEPYKLSCAWCDFKTLDPGEMVGHMISAGHGMSAETKAAMLESGGVAELENVIGGIQAGRIKGEPVTDGDE